MQVINAATVNANRLVPLFLICGCLYEHGWQFRTSNDDVGYQSAMLDSHWDQMCKRILREWNFIDHPHKKFITKSALEQGTASELVVQKLPKIVVGAIADFHARKIKVVFYPRIDYLVSGFVKSFAEEQK